MASRLRLAVVGSLVLAGPACGGVPRPSARLGALPFPGPFTLYEQVEPARLGPHRYGHSASVGRTQNRGIFYTCRGGFLDVSHVRDTIDWARYFTLVVEQALLDRRLELHVRGDEPSLYRVRVHLPASWQRLDATERTRRVHELSVDVGLHLAWVAGTWHEIVTWFGYRSSGFIPEDRSAFTYDDTISHALGLRVADEALRQREQSFDAAVTQALAREIETLGPVSWARGIEATERVRGDWWSGVSPRKRYLDLGFDDGVIEPWLVPDLQACERADPERFVVPRPSELRRPEGEASVEIEIAPKIRAGRDIRELLPGAPRGLRPERDFPAIVEHVRRGSIAVEGAGADRP